MIVTVTLNPAVDKTGRAGRLIPGEVNRMREVISEAGGKGINVTKVLRQFHLPVAALGFLGGYSGRMIEVGGGLPFYPHQGRYQNEYEYCWG